MKILEEMEAVMMAPFVIVVLILISLFEYPKKEFERRIKLRDRTR